MFQTFISRHNSNFFSDKLVLTSVTPASSAPVLQTPYATPPTLYFDSVKANGGDVFGLPDAGAEAPRSAHPEAAVDRDPLSVGEELASHRDVVVVSAEHLGETLVGQIAR